MIKKRFGLNEKKIKLNDKVHWLDLKQELKPMIDSIHSREQMEQFLNSMYTMLKNYYRFSQ